jgi:hypothetical protein
VPNATVGSYSSGVLSISPNPASVTIATGVKSIVASTVVISSGVKSISGATASVTYCAVCTSMITTLTVSSINYSASRIYGDAVSIPTIVFLNSSGNAVSGVTYTLSLLSSAGVSSSDSTTLAVGTYTASVSALGSASYRLATTGNATGSLTINPKTLTVTTTAANKTYDGNTNATLNIGSLNGLVGSETLTVTGEGPLIPVPLAQEKLSRLFMA